MNFDHDFRLFYWSIFLSRQVDEYQYEHYIQLIYLLVLSYYRICTKWLNKAVLRDV